MTHIESISNGLGAPSMYLFWLAGQRQIPATISITADTGDENDRICVYPDGTEERMSAQHFYNTLVVPLGQMWGIKTAFVRAVNKAGVPLPSILDHALQMVAAGRPGGIKMPLFGDKGGRLGQSCTQRWKIVALRQELRRQGATTARAAQGIHRDEAIRRMKGADRRFEAGFWTWNDIDGTINKGPNKGKPKVCQWSSHYYPLVERGMGREDTRQATQAAGVPYLKTSECDHCAHKDRTRWLHTSQAKLEELATKEAQLPGFFFTRHCIPLLEAVDLMRAQTDMFEDDPDFGCGNAVCGV